jgi:hypothetical protein
MCNDDKEIVLVLLLLVVHLWIEIFLIVGCSFVRVDCNETSIGLMLVPPPTVKLNEPRPSGAR